MAVNDVARNAFGAMKIHLLVTILITQFAALYLGKERVPYFPIEKSRTAATNNFSYAVLLGGVISLIFYFPGLLVQNGEAGYPLILGWIGFVVLAYYDDVTHWTLHMLGFALMVVGVSTSFVLSNRGVTSKIISLSLCCCCAVYLLRFVIKVVVVLGVEMDQSLLSLQTWKSFLFGEMWQKVVDRSMDIMYRGSIACVHPKYTMVAFKAAGALQWLFFFMLVELSSF